MRTFKSRKNGPWPDVAGIGFLLVWFIVIVISKKFPKNFIKLGQWILLLIIGCLICLSIK